jgi:hypothetical protein
MKKYLLVQERENAQVIPLVVISLAVLIMMVALLLDGGALMLNRRTAQNAADAGALAGARELCMGNGEDAAQEAAENYAWINLINKYVVSDINLQDSVFLADLAMEISKLQDKGYVVSSDFDTPPSGSKFDEIVVTVVEPHPGFFASIFNMGTSSSGAVAGAGCFNPTSNLVMPIAWSCRDPAIGSESEDCNYVNLNWNTEIKPVIDSYGPSEDSISDQLFSLYRPSIYIIMDSDKVCGVDIDCDFDNNQWEELGSGGNRGWLNLTGDSSGSPNLEDWIENGVDEPIFIHTWLSGTSGNRPPIYTALRTRIGDVVFIPVFNVICDDMPEDDPACETAAHATTPPGVPLQPGETDVVIAGNPATPLYHIVGFAPFYITCVHTGKTDNCPGFILAQDTNPSIKDNTNTVEGYFVTGYPFPAGDVGPGGVDLGNYIVSLTR